MLGCNTVRAEPATARPVVIVAARTPFAAFVAEASQRFGIPASWIRAVMRAESFGDVRAISPKGAIGLMQIMPETWAALRQRYRLGARSLRRARQHHRRCIPRSQTRFPQREYRSTYNQPGSRPTASEPLCAAGRRRRIPASLITGLRSDLPGQVTAQVTEDVYDSPTGKTLLIPQGSRLVGQYDAQIAFGQSRVLLVWTRLIMPNGHSIVLERQPGADTDGYAGLEDEVDNHWGMLFKAAILSTVLSVGSEAGMSGNNNGSLAERSSRNVAEHQSDRAASRPATRSTSSRPSRSDLASRCECSSLVTSCSNLTRDDGVYP